MRLDNTDNPDVPPGKPQKDLDFVYFGGLYRNVRLVVTDRLHVTDAVYAGKVAGGGIFVTYPSIDGTAATVEVKVNVKNEHASPRRCVVVARLFDGEGREVARTSGSGRVPAGGDATIAQTMRVASPRLWHPYHPHLYSLRIEVRDGDRTVDEVTTRVGIRRIRFDPAGFWINGERLVATGANRHQDFPYVGYALPDSVQYRDIKEAAGSRLPFAADALPAGPRHARYRRRARNAGHRLEPVWQWFRRGVFVDRAYQGVREMVRRDRNHPLRRLWGPY